MYTVDDREDIGYDDFQPSLIRKIIAFIVLAAVATGVGWVVKLFAPWSLLVLGFLMWWGLYAFSTAMNGGETNIASLLKFLIDDFFCAIPFYGRKHKMRLAKVWSDMPSACQTQEEIADLYPGFFHFLTMHIMVPFGPIALWYFFQ